MNIDLTSTPFTSLEELNVHLAEIARQTRAAFNRNDLITAQQLIEQVLEIVPEHVVALTDLAFVKNQLEKPSEAYQHLLKALTFSKNNVDASLYDAFVNSCTALNKVEEGLYYAKRSIARKKEQVSSRTIFPLPATPVPGLSADPKRNIISYSLFGENPRYCETAILNVELSHKIYPNWTCRFYVDESVPHSVIERLERLQAEVVYVDEEQKKIPGLFWRFAVLNDQNVQCFIIRDADSLLSYKEKAAVDEWLASGKWFHIMRDHIRHSELILAGMWGGYTGVFINMIQIIHELLIEVDNHNRIIDQVFLRNQVFPTVNQSVLIHDNYRLDPDSLPFPDYTLSEIERIPYFHIGMVDASALRLSLTIKDPQAKRVRWYLIDRENRLICSYESDVPESRSISISLPYFYGEKVERGEYRFVNNTVA